MSPYKLIDSGTACDPKEIFTQCDAPGRNSDQEQGGKSLNYVAATFADLSIQPDFTLSFSTKNKKSGSDGSVPGTLEFNAIVKVDLGITLMVSGHYTNTSEYPLGGFGLGVLPVCLGPICMSINLKAMLNFTVDLDGFAKVSMRLKREYKLHGKFQFDVMQNTHTTIHTGVDVISDNSLFESTADVKGLARAELIPEVEIAGAGLIGLSVKMPLALEAKVVGHFHMKRQKGSFNDDQSQCYTPSCQALAQKRDNMSCDPSQPHCNYCTGQDHAGGLIQLPRGTHASIDFSLDVFADMSLSYSVGLAHLVKPLQERCESVLNSNEYPIMGCLVGKADKALLDGQGHLVVKSTCDAMNYLGDYNYGGILLQESLYNVTLYEFNWKHAECRTEPKFRTEPKLPTQVSRQDFLEKPYANENVNVPSADENATSTDEKVASSAVVVRMRIVFTTAVLALLHVCLD